MICWSSICSRAQLDFECTVLLLMKRSSNVIWWGVMVEDSSKTLSTKGAKAFYTFWSRE